MFSQSDNKPVEINYFKHLEPASFQCFCALDNINKFNDDNGKNQCFVYTASNKSTAFFQFKIQKITNFAADNFIM